MSIAENLRAVGCQRLVRSVTGGMVPAVEILPSAAEAATEGCRVVAPRRPERPRPLYQPGSSSPRILASRDDSRPYGPNTPNVLKLLVRNQLDVLGAAIEKGREDGMQSFNQSVYDLIMKGIILDEGKSMLNT